ncbi:MAG: hypothetical protein A3F12_01665 [Gammaproteobacteria bacterium RIFCSPHIGHO2_12_FULL_38_14]|nr:MAG: hypothetical protein A3F12_01665 [Gammaproteobacteria bacterium RIFCSPHIGHO2_12_FULL_38_14]
MPHKSKRPEDMIPDDKSHFEMGGKTIRKGTMAAALTNAEIVESPDATVAEKQAAMETIKELAPVLKAFGLTKFLTWKNPKIQAIFDEME